MYNKFKCYIIQCETDEDGITSDRLSPQTISDLNRAGCKASTVHELLSGRNAKFIDYMKVCSCLLNCDIRNTDKKFSIIIEEILS